MSTLEIANENSSFLNYVHGAAPKTSPFTYALRKNAPKFSKQKMVEVAKTSRTEFSSEERFDIPKFGVLQSLVLKMALTFGDATSDSGYMGVLGCFDRFELRARDKTIATLYPEAIVDWVKTQSPEARAVWTDNDHMVSKSSYAAAATTWYVPLPFSFTERLSNAINTRYAEQLQLVVAVGSATKGLTNVSGSDDERFQFTLQCNYLSPGAEELQNMKQQMVKAGKQGIPRLQYSCYKESQKAVTNATTTTTIDLSNPYPTWRTVIMMKKGTTSRHLDLSDIVSRVQWRASGQDFVDLDAAELRHSMVKDGFNYDVYDQSIAGNQQIVVDFTEIVRAGAVLTVTVADGGLLFAAGDEVMMAGHDEAEVSQPTYTKVVSVTNDTTIVLHTTEPGTVGTGTDDDGTLTLIRRNQPKHDCFVFNWNLMDNGLDQTGVLSMKVSVVW